LTDLLLQHHQACEQRLRPRRATGDVDVDRDDEVDAGQRAVTEGEGPAHGGATAEGDDPLRLRHLQVDAAHGRGHLPGHGAGDDHEVGLARRGAEDLGAEAGDVVAGGGSGDHLDGAAGEAEHGRPQRGAARPVQQVLDGAEQQVLLEVLLDRGGVLDDGEPEVLLCHYASIIGGGW
jgi:hypothetical protein